MEDKLEKKGNVNAEYSYFVFFLPYCALATDLLFERSSSHAWENLHSNGTGRRGVLDDNCQAVQHNQIVMELSLKKIIQVVSVKKNVY